MTKGRLSIVIDALADAARDPGCSVIDAVCAAAQRLLGLSGAGVSLVHDEQLCCVAGETGPEMGTIHELQFALGEGPSLDAAKAGDPVLVSDLRDPTEARWPAFRACIPGAGVRAVFAFPLQLGEVCIGVLSMYRGVPGALSADELSLCLVLTEITTVVVLALQAGADADELHTLLAGEPSQWAKVHQATGMISAQLGTTLDEAFIRLRAHAFAEGRSIGHVAADVVSRRLRLDPV